MLRRPHMATDEAHALVKSLLSDVKDPDTRAKLVALQLALGFPHALEIEPDDLVELRAREVALSWPVARAQTVLGAVSIVSLVWYAVSAMLIGLLSAGGLPTLVIIWASFLSGLHALVGLGLATQRPDRAMAPLMRCVALAWLAAGAFDVAVAAYDPLLGAAASAWTSPSLLVALAAWVLARHTARR